MKFTIRNGHYHLRRRVPRRYLDIEPREYVWISMHTDMLDVAKRKAPAIWDEMLEAWEAKLRGHDADAEVRFDAARDLAATRGFRYLPAAQVARLPREELFSRIDAVGRDKAGNIDKAEAVAFLGLAEKPKLTISRALKDYWTLAKDKTIGKSADQLRRWENPRKKAIKNLIDVIGDKPLDEITPDDMADFRQWWIDRMISDELSANSANKDLIHIGSVFRTVNRIRKLGLNLPLADLSIRSGEKRTRPPFSTEWIQDKLLAPGALDGLNAEARAILLVMVNTGARPSEIAALGAEQIRLGADVPHISIEPVGRQLKSAYARRKIPLLGVSLEAMKGFKEGFPRYQDNSATLSATVNKYLRENGLLETDEHSLYSLRHAFEDRALKAGIDDRVRRDLFGHRLTRERYGHGADLAMLRDLMLPLAI